MLNQIFIFVMAVIFLTFIFKYSNGDINTASSLNDKQYLANQINKLIEHRAILQSTVDFLPDLSKDFTDRDLMDTKRVLSLSVLTLTSSIQHMQKLIVSDTQPYAHALDQSQAKVKHKFLSKGAS